MSIGRRRLAPLSFLFKAQQRDGCLRVRDNDQTFLASQGFLKVSGLATLQIFDGEETNLVSEIKNITQ